MWDLIVSVPDHCLSFYFVIAFLLFHRQFILLGVSTGLVLHKLRCV